MLQGLKDKALSKGAKLAINNQIGEYGEVTKLHLNSKQKQIQMDVLLHGEHESISVDVEHYEITDDNQIKIVGVSTSRVWITSLARNFLEGKEFTLPAEYAQMIRAVV